MNIKNKMENPIYIKIDNNPNKSVILGNEENIPLYPGCKIESGHYGFIIIMENGKEESIFPTQNEIASVGIVNDVLDDLIIFEKGKEFPWIFTYDGILENKSSFSFHSRSDMEYIEEIYGMSRNETIDYLSKNGRRHI